MTQEDVIRMAISCQLLNTGNRDGIYAQALQSFAKLVAAHEREACAKVCAELGNTTANMSQAWRNGCLDSAAEIRARGEQA